MRPVLGFVAVCAAFAVFALSTVPAHGEPAFRGLVLNELMINPQDLADADGEWIEIRNVGRESVELTGLAVEVGGAGLIAIPLEADAELAPGALLTLGRFPAAVDTAGTAYLVIPALTGGTLLPNEGATVRLWLGATLVDELTYGTREIPAPAGAALNREPHWQPWEDSTQVAFSASSEAHWCAARVPLADYSADRGTPGRDNTWCDDDDDGYAEDEGDCDDTLAAVAPDVPELCNGRDDNCDGREDEGPLDAHVWACLDEGVCTGVVPTCGGAQGWRCDYPESFEPEETICDAIDNDCDGETDEGLRNACGGCGALPDTLDICDGADNDCDGVTDEDAHRDDPGSPLLCLTEGECAHATQHCAGARGWLCDYPETYEEGEEASCDGLDNDCDGETDESFTLGGSCYVGLGECAAVGVRVCSPDGRRAVCDGTARAPGVEKCGDGLDNDCDGQTDEGFQLGEDCWVSVGECRAFGKLICSPNGFDVECSAPPIVLSAEVCGDARDNDCDGLVDEPECEAEMPPPTGPDECRDGACEEPPPAGGLSCSAGAGSSPGAAAVLVLLVLTLAVTRRRSRRAA